MDSSAGEIVGWLGGGAGSLVVVYKFAEWLVLERLKRGQKAEEQVEAKEQQEHDDTEAKLDQVLVLLGKMELEFARLGERFIQQAARVDALAARIDGISSSHGPKLDGITERVTRLEERVRGKR